MKTVVLGSINQDVIATVVRHPKPGETVTGQTLTHLPGGKGANEAVAAAATGVLSILIGAVGDDAAGAELIAFLESKDVGTRFVRTVPNTSTGTAIIEVDERGENTIVFVPGANDMVDDDPEVELAPTDVALSQLEVPTDAIVRFFTRARQAGSTTILNPSPVKAVPDELMSLVDVLVLNESELSQLSGVDVEVNDRLAVRDVASKLRPEATVVVTLGDQGAIAVGAFAYIDVVGLEVDAVDTTGAGDCFVGTVAAEMASGVPMEAALDFANKAAALCVTRQGAGPSMPSRAEVEAFDAYLSES